MGTMVKRYWVMDAAGLYYAGHEEFNYDQDQAIVFTREDDAEEIADAHAGSAVEGFERWSAIPDPLPITDKSRALSEALNYVQHWRRDRDNNLPPTIESLNHIERVIRDALAA